jgi:hypothetical protein
MPTAQQKRDLQDRRKFLKALKEAEAASLKPVSPKRSIFKSLRMKLVRKSTPRSSARRKSKSPRRKSMSSRRMSSRRKSMSKSHSSSVSLPRGPRIFSIFGRAKNSNSPLGIKKTSPHIRSMYRANFSFGESNNLKSSSDSGLFMMIISDPRSKKVAADELRRRHRELTNDQISEYARLIKSVIGGLDLNDPYVQNYIKYLTKEYIEGGDYADTKPYTFWRKSLYNPY